MWEVIRFEDYIYKNDDSHNVTVIGICPDDGTIHLAFDHHGDDLHYRASLPGVVDNPENFEWNASLFGSTHSDLISGQPLSRVTYPRFVSGPNDKLYLRWRNGKSSDGRIWMSEYSHGAWEAPWQITSSDGTWHQREVPILVSTMGNKWRHRARVVLDRNNTAYLVMKTECDKTTHGKTRRHLSSVLTRLMATYIGSSMVAA